MALIRGSLESPTSNEYGDAKAEHEYYPCKSEQAPCISTFRAESSVRQPL